MKYWQCLGYSNGGVPVRALKAPCRWCYEITEQQCKTYMLSQDYRNSTMSQDYSYWKPCGHSIQLTCNCPNNGEKGSVEGQVKVEDPVKLDRPTECKCDVWRGGCICGYVTPYKPEDIK